MLHFHFYREYEDLAQSAKAPHELLVPVISLYAFLSSAFFNLLFPPFSFLSHMLSNLSCKFQILFLLASHCIKCVIPVLFVIVSLAKLCLFSHLLFCQYSIRKYSSTIFHLSGLSFFFCTCPFFLTKHRRLS